LLLRLFSLRTGAQRNAIRDFDERGALQRWPEGLEARGHARRPSVLAPIGGGCSHGRLSLIRRRNPASRFAVPLHTSPTTQIEAPPEAMRGSASPKGEARREAPPSRRAAPGAAGRITGGGGRGGSTKPNQARLSAPPSNPPAVAHGLGQLVFPPFPACSSCVLRSPPWDPRPAG